MKVSLGELLTSRLRIGYNQVKTAIELFTVPRQGWSGMFEPEVACGEMASSDSPFVRPKNN